MNLRRPLAPIPPGTSGAVATAFIGQLVIAVSGILAARILGVENRGYMALFILLPTIICSFGLVVPVAATYYIAAKPEDSREIIRRLAGPAIGLLVLLTGVYAVVLLILFADARSELRATAAVTLLLVPGHLIRQCGLALLQGTRRFLAFNLLRTLPALCYAAGMVGLYLAPGVSLFDVVLLWVSSTFIVGALALGVSLRRLPARTSISSAPSRRTMLRFGARGWLGVSSPGEYFQLDQAIAGLFLSPSALGLYVTAVAFTNLPRFVGQSVGMIAYPSVAASAPAQRRATMFRFVGITVVVVGVLVVALEAVVGWLLPTLFGERFKDAVPIAHILLAGMPLVAVRRTLIDAVRGAARPGLGSIAELVSVVTLMGFALVLVPPLGVDGVAIALLLAAATSLLALCVGLTLPTLRHWFLSLRQRALRRSVALPMAIAGLAIAAGSLILLAEAQATQPTGVFVPLGTLVIAAYPIAVRVIRGRLDLFEPILVGAVTLGLLFGVRPLWFIITGDGTYQDTPFWSASHLPDAYFVGFAATLAFVATYEAGSFRGLRRTVSTAAKLDARRAIWLALMAATTGVVLYCLYLGQAGSVVEGLKLAAGGRSVRAQQVLGPSSEYLTTAPILAACGAVLLILSSGGNRTARTRLLIVALIAIPVVIFFFAGQRRFIVPVTVIPVVTYYLISRRRPRWRTLAAALPVAFLVLAIIPFARTEGGRQQEGGLAAIFSRGLVNPVETGRKFITGVDTAMVETLAYEIATLDKSGGYGYGSATFGDLVLAPIPSAVLHGKPETARNKLLTRMYGAPCTTVNGQCPDFSAPGTFYQDLGLFGVLLGMAGLGWLSSAIWRFHLADPNNRYRLSAAACWVVFLPILLRAGFMPGFAWFLYFVIPIWVMIRITVRSPQEGPSSSSIDPRAHSVTGPRSHDSGAMVPGGAPR